MPSQFVSPPTFHAPHVVSEEHQAGPGSQHARLVGGVVGAMSGLTMILLVLLLLWRRRMRSQKAWSEIKDERLGPRPFLLSKNSMRDVPQYREKGTPKPPEVTVSQAPIIDGNLIRMSLDHWERPYAVSDPFHSQNQANRLRITNPDPPRGDSPLPLDNPRRFLSRQRSALAVVLATFKRTPSSQTIPQQPRPSMSPISASPLPSRQPSPFEAPHQPSPLLPSPHHMIPRLPPQAFHSNRSSTSSSPIRARPLPDAFLAKPQQMVRGLPVRLVASRTPSYDDRPLTVASAKTGEGDGEDRVLDRFLEGQLGTNERR